MIPYIYLAFKQGNWQAAGQHSIICVLRRSCTRGFFDSLNGKAPYNSLRTRHMILCGDYRQHRVNTVAFACCRLIRHTVGLLKLSDEYSVPCVLQLERQNLTVRVAVSHDRATAQAQHAPNTGMRENGNGPCNTQPTQRDTKAPSEWQHASDTSRGRGTMGSGNTQPTHSAEDRAPAMGTRRQHTAFSDLRSCPHGGAMRTPAGSGHWRHSGRTL